MPRWSYSNRAKDTACLRFDIFWLRRQGYLKGYASGLMTWSRASSDWKASIGFSCDTRADQPYIELDYTFRKGKTDEESINYKIRLAKTPCRLGGFRYWFVCPGLSNGMFCGRRCAVLYSSKKYYVCRKCNSLLYDSQFETRLARFDPGFRFIKYEAMAEKLMKELKRRTYRGRPTKKMRRIERLSERTFREGRIVDGFFDIHDMLG
jgi:hypothetical protein